MAITLPIYPNKKLNIVMSGVLRLMDGFLGVYCGLF